MASANEYSDDFESVSSSQNSASRRERVFELGNQDVSASIISPSPRLTHRRVVRGYKLATSSSFNYSDDFEPLSHASNTFQFLSEETPLDNNVQDTNYGSSRDFKSYGTDTFESEESKKSSFQYGTDTFVSETHSTGSVRSLSQQSSVDYSDTFESTDIVSPTDDRNKNSESESDSRSWETESEESDTETEDSLDRERAAEAREVFIELKIQQAFNPSQTPEEEEIAPTHPKMDDFCSKKIETALRNREYPQNMDWSILRRSEPQERIAKYGLSEGVIEKLRLENLMIKMKKMAQEENHRPEKCKKCRRKKESLLESHFIKQKLSLLGGRMIDEKMKNAEAKDALYHLGGMVHTLPKPTEEPENIWQRLMAPLESKPPPAGS